jgi:predicted nucleic acid-binding protein
VKTYVFDASALFAFLEKRACASKIADLLKEAVRGRTEILMSALNYGEVYGVTLRKYGPERASATLGAIRPLPIRLLDVTPQAARRAADIKFRYKLHYLDSFAAALAVDHKATLVSSDSDFRNLGNTVSLLWLKS